MFIKKVSTKNKAGKVITFHYLCHSERKGDKVATTKIASLGKTQGEIFKNLKRLKSEGLHGTPELFNSLLEAFDRDIWGTPPWVIDRAKLVLGRIDLDPCTQSSNPTGAVNFHTEENDGLTQPWKGTVWMNPPYSSPQPWLQKLSESYLNGEVTSAIALVKSGTFQNKGTSPLIATSTARFLWKGRLQFAALRDGIKSKSPDFDVAMAYWGDNPQLFLSTFADVNSVA